MPKDKISAKGNPTFKDLTNTFVLSTVSSSSEQVLSEIPKALSVDPGRRRRSHQKSRVGCENCRRRRVKCSEETPCANCTWRGDRCQRRMQNNGTFLTSSAATETNVNLLHLRLFHHFHTNTRQTLLCGHEAWEHALQLSFQFDFLMNAVLCISARHLAVLHPEDQTYKTTAMMHLCRASSGLRQELSKGGTSIHFDAFLATSILLYYDTWTNTDYFLPLDKSEAMSDASTDRVFGFSFSLKKTLLACFQRPSSQPSVFRKHLMLNPGDVLVAASHTSTNTIAKYQDFFSYHRPISFEMLNTPFPSYLCTDKTTSDPQPHSDLRRPTVLDPVEDAYASVVSRLCLILPFLSETQRADSNPSTAPSLTPALAKYILSFPLLGWNTFPSMVERGDLHALLLLYHFYRAVRILLTPGEWWWAHKRAAVAESVLRGSLVNGINKQSKPW
ncbi:hypothetical protein HD806DRAFT_543732 [Xylariaceae sp. AK1471]|nr:hypothetical protein HD806DRAFT_543732 [Xylariaceae sp. AK1471]